MADQVSIINKALLLLAAERIVGPEDDNPNTEKMYGQWDDAVDFVIAAYPWDFAETDAQIAATGTTPLFDWEQQYVLPTDPYCLKVWKAGTATPPDWEVKGRRLYINESGPLNITYGAQITDPGQFDPGFVQALSAYLAWGAAYSITRKRSKTKEMWEFYEDLVTIGHSSDGQQGVPRVRFPNSFLESRH